MGYYIQTGNAWGKAFDLVTDHEAVEVPQPANFSNIPHDKALICVVDNGPFDAAGYCFDSREFEAFTEPDDTRPKTWLLMDKEEAERISNFVGSADWTRRQGK